MRFIFIIALMCLLSGCGSSRGTIRFSGIDSAEMRRQWNEMVPRLAGDPRADGRGLSVHVTHSPTAGTNSTGPYSCDDNGCWHGLNQLAGNFHHIQYPEGTKIWTKRHELMHSALYRMYGLGGHPEWVTLRDGRRIKPRDVIGGRWPMRITQSVMNMVPGGKTPFEPWEDQWEGLSCPGVSLVHPSEVKKGND